MIKKRRNGFSREFQGCCMKGISDTFGTKVPPTSFHLALMRLFISVCNLSMILDDLYHSA